MTQGNQRLTGRSPSEDPVLTVSQKPKISKQSSDSLQGTLASGAVWTEGQTVGHCDTHSFHDEILLCFGFVVVVLVCVFLFWGEVLKGKGQI